MTNMISLIKRVDIPVYEDFDKYCSQTLQDSPKVSMFMHVTYQIKNIEFEARQFIGSYRLPVQTQTLGQFIESNGFLLTSKGILDSIDKAKGVHYRGRDDDEVERTSYEMIARKHKDSIFIGKLPRGTSIDKLSEYELKCGYILFQTGKNMVREVSYNYAPKEVAASDLRKVLHSVLADKKLNRGAKSFEDAIECVSRLNKQTVARIKPTMQRIYAGHKLWDTLTAKELHELLNEEDDLAVYGKISLEKIYELKELK